MLELLDLKKKRFWVWFEPSWGITENNLRNIALHKTLNSFKIYIPSEIFSTLVKFWTTPIANIRYADRKLTQLDESVLSINMRPQILFAEAPAQKL